MLRGNVVTEERYPASYGCGCLYSWRTRSQKNCLQQTCVSSPVGSVCAVSPISPCASGRGEGEMTISSFKWLLNVKNRNLSLVVWRTPGVKQSNTLPIEVFAFSRKHKIICILGTFEEVQTDNLLALKIAPKFLPLVVRGYKRVVLWLMFACCPVKTVSVAKTRVQVRKSPGTDAEGKMGN